MSATDTHPRPLVGWTGIALLCTLYFVSFVDRTVLGLLVDPLKASLDVGDVEMGLLMGPAFALFYGIVGIPMARLADTGNRKNLIVAGVLIWGACTLFSGFVTTFLMLIALRIGLAVGEAVLTPSANSLIADWFPPRAREVPSSVYVWSGQMGAMLGFMLLALLVGFVVERHGLSQVPFFSTLQPWQSMFVVIGLPTIALGFLTMLIIKEPPRIDSGKADEAGESLLGAFAYMRRNAALYVGLLVGSGLNTLAPAALGAWGPQLLKRNFGWAISEAGLGIGAVLAVSSVLGLLVIPRIVEHFRNRSGDTELAIRLGVFGTIVGNVLMAAAAIAPSPTQFLGLWGVGQLVATLAGIVGTLSIPLIAPPRMRAVAAAVNLLICSAIPLSLGPLLAPVIGSVWFSDQASVSLAWGVAVVAISVPFATVPLLIWAKKPYGAIMRAQLQLDPRPIAAASDGSAPPA